MFQNFDFEPKFGFFVKNFDFRTKLGFFVKNFDSAVEFRIILTKISIDFSEIRVLQNPAITRPCSNANDKLRRFDCILE